ncbi:uncharacterized protein LOC105205425 isoform X2 [Solenopsis invicta]|uniref:uncharacterized protein LOC105205425 isoform X2 n=1 Tax=Solenopsis invicta TaxID=13686 RepID=UPI00193E6D0E|nr:uncharacterized protein LOC105205425 isoform X2 [Solenopsis invicta]
MFYCNFCNFGTPYLKKHLDHHIYHRNITYFYYCGYDRCKKCFQSGTYLRAHLRRTHGLHSKKHETFLSIAFSADERGKFVCTINICKKKFDNFHLLIKHLKKHINKNQQIQCPFRNCKRRYFVLSSFTSHISKIHKNRYDQAEIVTVENPVVESEESLNNTLLEIDDQPNMIVQHEPYNAQYDADESDLFLKNVGQFYLKLENRKMPLFKVESPIHKRIMIKANSISEIIEIAIKKLKLPEDNTYKLLLQNDGTEIDDNDVLLEYAEQSKDMIVLTILGINMSSDYDKKNEDNQIVLNESSSTMQRNDISDSSSISTCSEALSSSNRSSTKVKSINLEDGVWSKLSERIVAACVRGDKLCFSDRKAVIQKIVEYMIDTLKNTTRSKAHEIATILCNTYPKTFADTIGNDEMWGSGLETVRLEIYNACLYKINSKKRKSFSKATNYDSDDAEQEERQQQATSRRQDEYGCVEMTLMMLM